MIDTSGPGSRDDNGDQIAALRQLLEALAPEEMVSFDRHKGELMQESYRADLWHVVYIRRRVRR